jgi:hypothetical protein
LKSPQSKVQTTQELSREYSDSPGVEQKNEVDKAKIIQELTVKSLLFPDNCHPSSEYFKQLAQRIIKMI